MEGQKTVQTSCSSSKTLPFILMWFPYILSFFFFSKRGWKGILHRVIKCSIFVAGGGVFQGEGWGATTTAFWSYSNSLVFFSIIRLFILWGNNFSYSGRYSDFVGHTEKQRINLKLLSLLRLQSFRRVRNQLFPLLTPSYSSYLIFCSCACSLLSSSAFPTLKHYSIVRNIHLVI